MKRKDVVGALIQQKDQVLLAQRSCEDLNRKWEFPGGKVEPKETHQSALRREIKEELGIEIAVGKKEASNDFHVGEKKYTLHCYWAEIRTGEPVPDQHHSIAWVPLADLLKYDLAPADRPIAERVSKHDRRD